MTVSWAPGSLKDNLVDFKAARIVLTESAVQFWARHPTQFGIRQIVWGSPEKLIAFKKYLA
jgi:hypothetical protein